MIRTKILAAALGTALAGAAAVLPSTATAGGNVAWNVSVGGPGFAVSAGQPGYYGYGAPYRPYYRPAYGPYRGPYYRPAPVVYRPYYAPVRVVAPAPVVVAPRVVYSQPYYAPVVPVPY